MQGQSHPQSNKEPIFALGMVKLDIYLRWGKMKLKKNNYLNTDFSS